MCLDYCNSLLPGLPSPTPASFLMSTDQPQKFFSNSGFPFHTVQRPDSHNVYKVLCYSATASLDFTCYLSPAMLVFALVTSSACTVLPPDNHMTHSLLMSFSCLLRCLLPRAPCLSSTTRPTYPTFFFLPSLTLYILFTLFIVSLPTIMKVLQKLFLSIFFTAESLVPTMVLSYLIINIFWINKMLINITDQLLWKEHTY